MSTQARRTPGRWMNWKPKARILTETAESEPTKPSKPGFVGFEGATSGLSPKIEGTQPPETHPSGDEQIARASWVLNLTGTRMMRGDTGLRIGIWEDLDGPELRECIRTLGMGACRVLYLESEIPLRYKVRLCPDRLKGESFQAFLKRAEHIHRERFPHRWEVSA